MSLIASVKESADEKGYWWTSLGLFILIGAIIGGSSIGAIANFIPVETSFAKNAWRSGLVATMFIPPAIVEFFYKRSSTDYSKILSWK